jgi:trk system potassium uptake protein
VRTENLRKNDHLRLKNAILAKRCRQEKIHKPLYSSRPGKPCLNRNSCLSYTFYDTVVSLILLLSFGSLESYIMGLRKFLYDSPGRTVLLSIIFTIGLGTALLMLPAAQKVPISFVDCLFTATSSTCVTGVLTIPFESFTLFGKCIILALIQIGGIGLLTLWLFLVSLFVTLGISTQFMIGQVLELTMLKNPRHILYFIIGFTLLAELIGAATIYWLISPLYPPSEALFHSIFHSISSFCNAGLSSFGHSMISFTQNIPLLGITALLIFLGGIGFMTIYECFFYFKKRFMKKRYQFSLTTRVVCAMVPVLIGAVTLLLLWIEGPGHFSNQSFFVTISNMIFNAIAYRSAGLTTIAISSMQTATVFMIIMYSFIGSSPVSTGSGIKITTFALFLATIRSVIKGRMVVEIKGRRIPQDQIFKAMAVLSLSVCWITASTFCLALIESQSSFISVFFEAVSSFTNLGLATEITPLLSIPGKLLIICNMLMGRVGTLTLMLALRIHRDRGEFQYPEERLMMS